MKRDLSRWIERLDDGDYSEMPDLISDLREIEEIIIELRDYEWMYEDLCK